MRPLLVGALRGHGVPQGGAGAELAAVGGVGGGPLAEVAAGALQGAPRAAAGRRARPIVSWYRDAGVARLARPEAPGGAGDGGVPRVRARVVNL